MRRIIGDPAPTIEWRCYLFISSDNEHLRRQGERPRQQHILHGPAEVENPPCHQIAHWDIITAQRGGSVEGDGFFL